MKNAALYYSVGALLYCPANNQSIAASIQNGKLGAGYSLALCLEDTINDRYVPQAEEILIQSLQHLFRARHTSSFFMPKIFIRVRNAAQMTSLLNRLAEAREVLFGFIIPKLDLNNVDEYIRTVLLANDTYTKPFYIMPIMESRSMIDLRNRTAILYGLKERLQKIESLILNIRVGGNDLCHAFGFRRHNDESIHSIRPVANLFSDIITAFGTDYVVSGPVWEYYNGEGWDAGLKQELKEDRLSGFIGKTVIHPKQIPLVQKAYTVTPEDLADAKAILTPADHMASLVSGNVQKQRMNEYKTHTNWARQTLYLAEAYGVQ